MKSSKKPPTLIWARAIFLTLVLPFIIATLDAIPPYPQFYHFKYWFETIAGLTFLISLYGFAELPISIVLKLILAIPFYLLLGFGIFLWYFSLVCSLHSACL